MDDDFKGRQVVANSEILMFILGWQGGTIHQLERVLDISAHSILNADYEDMQTLMRIAQKKRRDSLKKSINEIVNDLRCQIDGGEECRGMDQFITETIRKLEAL